MKNISFLAFVIIVTFVHFTNAAQNRNILWNEYKDKTKSLSDVSVWRNKLKQEVQNNLNKLPENVKQEIIKAADNASNSDWPSFLAMDYLEFVISGNRGFEDTIQNRRKKIINLILGEMLTEKGKYMNQIANGVWLTLEESTWVWPAHLFMQKAGLGLPDPTEFVLDLGAGEASAQMAWIKFLMGEKLAKINPMIPKRIDYELNRRLIRPFLDTNFTNWMGFNDNNVSIWNIWINTNTLMTALLVVDNTTLRDEVIAKAVHSADNFLNGYGDDGGCDEGPGYWRQAGGRLIEFLNYISSASGNQINFSKYPLFRNIGEYIYKLHINGDRFANFADNAGKIVPEFALILKYGTLFDDQTMKGFASYVYHLSGEEKSLIDSANVGDLNAFFNQISAYELIKSIPPKAPLLAESWLPDLQVIALRSEEGTAKGLFLGAKAATNDESHKHNDVGNFVLYVDGMPAIIDVGVATYTAQTFSKDRYKLWNVQSQWHNTPTINGVLQHDTYVAHNVKYTKTTNGGEFELDIAGAYPTEADVKSWVRKFTFDRNINTVNLKETFELNHSLQPFKVHFITALNETQSTEGLIVLKDKSVSINMHYNSSLFDVEVDQHKTDDQRLSQVWGDHVSRVTLVCKQFQTDLLKGEFTTTFSLK